MLFPRKPPIRRRLFRGHPVLQAMGVALFVFCVAVFWVAKNQQFGDLNASGTPVENGETLQVFTINVGQGDALLLRCGGHDMLVDAGPNSSANGLIKYLDELDVSTLDIVVGTHPHEDHIGGLDAVIDKYEIGTLIMPEHAANTKTFEDVLDAVSRKNIKVTVPVPGQVYELGDAEITILGPQKDTYKDTNNYSVVLRADFGETSFLLTGDAEKESELDMVEAGMSLKADVLKAGHHGSNSSSSDEFLEAVQPKYVVISVGEDNSYGHPHKEPLKRYSDLGADVYRTDIKGTVLVESDGKTLKIKTSK